MKKQFTLLFVSLYLLSGCSKESNVISKSTDSGSTQHPESNVIDSVETSTVQSNTHNTASTTKDKVITDENYAVKNNYSFKGKASQKAINFEMDFEGKLYDDGFYMECTSQGETESVEYYFDGGKYPMAVQYNKSNGKYYYSQWAAEYTLSEFLDAYDLEKSIKNTTWEFVKSETENGTTFDRFKSTDSIPFFMFSIYQLNFPTLEFKAGILSKVTGTINVPTEDTDTVEQNDMSVSAGKEAMTCNIEFDIVEIGNQTMGHEKPIKVDA